LKIKEYKSYCNIVNGDSTPNRIYKRKFYEKADIFKNEMRYVVFENSVLIITILLSISFKNLSRTRIFFLLETRIYVFKMLRHNKGFINFVFVLH